jgi:hypothetical protein
MQHIYVHWQNCEVTVNFVMSVHLAAWNNLAPIGQFFMKFDISRFTKSLAKIHVSLKSDKNVMYIHNILLNSS